MGKRSSARRVAMQTLFQLDTGHTPDDIKFLLDTTKENENFLDETMVFADELVRGVLKNQEAIDKIIVEKSIGWSIERITSVDRSILRLAIYEMNFGGTPASIVINEAVNLAKKFSTAESSKFVNGILGGLVENIAKV